MLSRLEPTGAATSDRLDVDGANHPMRQVTVDAAAGRGWDAARAASVAGLFDGLAAGWSARVGSEAARPVADALDRGGVPSGGRCLEVGSGTGNVTPYLVGSFDAVLCVDLSGEMLSHAPARPGFRVRADAACLPVPARSVHVVALVNAFLFPAEVDRVLVPTGVVLWVSSLGDRTPIYLPPDEVLGSLPGNWNGTCSSAGAADWLVARRAD